MLGDFRAAAAQRLCIGMARLPGCSAQPIAAAMESKTLGSRRWRRPGAERGAVRGMLCSRIRRRLSGARTINRGQGCARDRSLVALGDVRSVGPLSAGGSFSELYDRYDHAGREAVRRRPCADPRRHSLDVDRADRREPQFIQWPAGVCLHHFSASVAAFDCSPIRLESHTARPRMGLRLIPTRAPRPNIPAAVSLSRSAEPWGMSLLSRATIWICRRPATLVPRGSALKSTTVSGTAYTRRSCEASNFARIN